MRRKLAVILVADVVGYSRLIESDEEGTISRLKLLRSDLIDSLISKHSGRVIKSMGDGLLVEFDSAVDAVKCSVEVQKQTAKSQRDQSPENQIIFRIGINLGDVVVEADDIHGEGVNVAARLESIAEPGQISISGTVYDQVHSKLNFGFESHGEQELKNISAPVRVYRIMADESGPLAAPTSSSKSGMKTKGLAAAVCVLLLGIGLAVWQPWRSTMEPAAIEKMVRPLPAKSSIVVLPFQTSSQDKKVVTFSDALNANITSGLSRFRGLFVIARNSALTYKNKLPTPKQVSETLGVRYILQGRIEPREKAVRVTTQLIDAISGENIWVNQFDRELGAIFDVQDEITKSVVTALPGRVRWAEDKRLRHTGAEFLSAYEKLARAEELIWRFTPKDNKAGLKLAESAIESDPHFARAYAIVGWAHLNDWQWYGVDNPQESLRLAEEFARKAISTDPSEPEGYTALGYLLLYKRQHEASLAMLQKGLEVNPNYADLIAGMADPLLFCGRPEEAVKWIKRAMRLNPFHPNWYYFQKGIAHYVAKQYEETIATIKQASPIGEARRLMAASYAYLGDMDNAQARSQEVLKGQPDFYCELLGDDSAVFARGRSATCC